MEPLIAGATDSTKLTSFLKALAKAKEFHKTPIVPPVNPQPTIWNIIIAGSWNPYILTPNGVRKHVLGLGPLDPLEIEIEVDTPGFFRANYNKVAIIPRPHFLEFNPLSPDLDGLKTSAKYADFALSSLPQTPVTGAGVNFRFVIAEPEENFTNLFESPVNDVISDAGFTIQERGEGRILKVDGGMLNLQVHSKNFEIAHVDLNFHCESQKPETLRDWLKRCDEFDAAAQKLINEFKKL